MYVCRYIYDFSIMAEVQLSDSYQDAYICVICVQSSLAHNTQQELLYLARYVAGKR
jgi:uncharacterized protein YlxP (DUF503 family)